MGIRVTDFSRLSLSVISHAITRHVLICFLLHFVSCSELTKVWMHTRHRQNWLQGTSGRSCVLSAVRASVPYLLFLVTYECTGAFYLAVLYSFSHLPVWPITLCPASCRTYLSWGCWWPIITNVINFLNLHLHYPLLIGVRQVGFPVIVVELVGEKLEVREVFPVLNSSHRDHGLTCLCIKINPE